MEANLKLELLELKVLHLWDLKQFKYHNNIKTCY